jgi:hypothetical protein
MEKIKITEKIKFKDLPENTPSTLRNNLKNRTIVFEVEGLSHYIYVVIIVSKNLQTQILEN